MYNPLVYIEQTDSSQTIAGVLMREQLTQKSVIATLRGAEAQHSMKMIHICLILGLLITVVRIPGFGGLSRCVSIVGRIFIVFECPTGIPTEGEAARKPRNG